MGATLYGSERNNDKCINILHMSDFHYTAKPNSDRDEILNRFIERIACTPKPEDKPDVIAITGDITQNGETGEYEAFYDDFLSELLNALKLDMSNIVLCPGNHDVIRKYLKKGGLKLNRLDDLKNIPREYSKVFEGYINFCRKRGIELPNNSLKSDDDKKYLYGHKEIKGIHFITMNSAWNCREKGWDKPHAKGSEDHGKLIIDKYLLNDAINKMKPQLIGHKTSNNVVIMLTHHPFFFDTSNGEFAKCKKERVDCKKDSACVICSKYVSNNYQWLKSPEIFETESRGCFVDLVRENVSIVLAGHVHEQVGPLPVLNWGTVGYIAGAMYKDNEFDPSCQTIKINDDGSQECAIHKYERQSDRNYNWTIGCSFIQTQIMHKIRDAINYLKNVNITLENTKEENMELLNDSIKTTKLTAQTAAKIAVKEQGGA